MSTLGGVGAAGLAVARAICACGAGGEQVCESVGGQGGAEGGGPGRESTDLCGPRAGAAAAVGYPRGNSCAD
jgi:hypothetical protein